jgi:hypothetical protein
MGKYDKYVNELRLWTEVVRPAYRGKISDFTLIWDRKVYPDAPFWVENFHVFAPGAGVGVPGQIPAIVAGGRATGVGGHAHDDCDELFLFLGSDPHDTLSLGGEVEFWLGEGEDAQKFIAKTPTAEWVPKGLAHNPHYFTKVKDPNKPIIEMVIALKPTYTLDPKSPGANRPTKISPEFSFDKVGQEQPGKGLYTEYVNELKLSQSLVHPSHRGKVATPCLMFDKNVYPKAPLWVELFYVYAAGAGTMVPTLEPSIFEGQVMPTGGGGHAHDFDELFLFLSLDPYDTLNLGGVAESWLGEGDEAEKFEITKSTGVFVPAGVVHNPQYFKRVDRPYLMAVIALTNEYGPESITRVTPLPPAFKF